MTSEEPREPAISAAPAPPVAEPLAGEPLAAEPPAAGGAAPPSRMLLGALAGLVAAAATAGALVGFGLRQGGADRLFAALGRLALGGPVLQGGGEQSAVIVIGVVLHVGAVTLLGVLFGLVAAGARGLRLTGLALLAALLAALVQVALAPSVLRFGNDVTAFPLQRTSFVALYLMLAAGLGLGMRVAHLCLRLEERSR